MERETVPYALGRRILLVQMLWPQRQSSPQDSY